MKTILFDEPFAATLRLEGELTSDVAADLCTRVAMLQGLNPSKAFRLDLGDVTTIDGGGAECLRRLHGRGVQFAVAGPAVQPIVDEIRGDSKAGLCAWLARIGIRVPEAEVRRQSRLCRIVCALLPQELAPCGCPR